MIAETQKPKKKVKATHLKRLKRGRSLFDSYRAFQYDPTPLFIYYIDTFCERKKLTVHQMCKKYSIGYNKIDGIMKGNKITDFKYIMWVVDLLREPITFI